MYATNIIEVIVQVSKLEIKRILAIMWELKFQFEQEDNVSQQGI